MHQATINLVSPTGRTRLRAASRLASPIRRQRAAHPAMLGRRGEPYAATSPVVLSAIPGTICSGAPNTGNEPASTLTASPLNTPMGERRPALRERRNKMGFFDEYFDPEQF